MKALITGGSSGIGLAMAKVLAKMGHELILVGQTPEKLEKARQELGEACVETYAYDLSLPEACFELYEKTRDKGVDILINSAGFGVFGGFTQTDLSTELSMIDVNIKASHILTKLFIKDFAERNSGYIMNIASAAAFVPGPLFSAYYASKAYILRLTEALYEEMRQADKNVHVSVFCPGPVRTGFNKRAGTGFAVSGMEADAAAEYAIKGLFAHKLLIIPGTLIKVVKFFQRFFSDKQLLKMTYKLQIHRTKS